MDDALLWSPQDDSMLRQQAVADAVRGFQSEASDFQSKADIDNWKKSKKDWATQLMGMQPKMPSMGGGMGGGSSGAGAAGEAGASDLMMNSGMMFA